jgi:signal transduction histidine kinase
MSQSQSLANLAQRLAFLDLTEEDRQLLADLRPILEQQADRLVSTFYQHLLSFEPTRNLLAEPEVKERLLLKQREYLLSLAGAKIDEAYVEERLHIGRVHERLGLEPRFYFGSYRLYFSLLQPLVNEACAGEPGRAERTLDALLKVLVLDAELATEAYVEGRERELEYLNRELADAGHELALQVQKRTSELRLTRRRARAAEELASVATLAAGLAHEIGTPMGVIRGHAELLESAVEDDRSRWRLKTITEQIDRISGIIQALLNLSRPREPVRQPTDVTEVVEGTLTFLTEKLRRRGIATHRDYQPVSLVHADPEKLQQVFLNLLLNAIDAMNQGGSLNASVRPGEDGWVEVRLADTGPGIPEEELPRIFEAFYTTKQSGAGNGLGLVVANSIVADHGGNLEVSSEPGEGTEFRIALPPLEELAQEGDPA